MHVAHTDPTSAGCRLCAAPHAATVPMTPGEARNLAAKLDRQADLHLALGERELAERLSWRAAALRQAVPA